MGWWGEGGYFKAIKLIFILKIFNQFRWISKQQIKKIANNLNERFVAIVTLFLGKSKVGNFSGSNQLL